MGSVEELSLEPQFVQDVDQYLKEHEFEDVNAAINFLQQRYKQYKFAENQILRRRRTLLQKESELRNTLACVQMLAEKNAKSEEAVVNYQLAANIYAKARIQPVTHVNLWLGADVMLEYPLDEALGVLDTNLKSCSESLGTNKDQWGKVKDCITTTEVNMARCYNHDVERRQSSKKAQAQ